jgi:hypothetical protein
VTFNRGLSVPSLQPADLSVRRLPGDPPFSATAVSYDAPTRTATFTLAGQQPLPNGNYRATLAAGSVTDASGTALAAAFTAEYFVLAGDINRDRRVDGNDFALLASNFGKTGRTYAQGDLNGDGRVDGSDFAVLAANFGKSVSPPAPAAVSARARTPAVGARAPQATRPARRRIRMVTRSSLRHAPPR